MNQNEIYISRFSAWAPGIENAEEWEEWAQGKRTMICSADSPGIKFTDPMLRRRISQISKMTIQTVHGILPVKDDTKMLFVSFRGEIHKQFSVNKMQIEDNNILPAAFSFSVFNAPTALTSMALDLKGGYTAVYPADNSIKAGLSAAYAMLNTEPAEELIFVYADENIPEEYTSLVSEPLPPFAFSLLLSKNQNSDSVCLSDICSLTGKEEIDPADFLKKLIIH